MARYIDAELLKQQDFQDYSKTDVEYAIDHCPTADVVEVVHCKDCKHGHWNQETCHGKPIYYCDRTDLQVSKFSFCSYGQRK